MTSVQKKTNRPSPIEWTELLLVVALITLDVVARLIPHAPNFTPVAATALFAGSTMRRRTFALAVPLLGMLLSDAVVGFYDWRVMSVVYASLAVPAIVGIVSQTVRVPLLMAQVLSCSLFFFAASNLAVWAFSGMYAPDLAGLIKCYLAALPFLQNTVAGDLTWAAMLFGTLWVVRISRASSRAAVRPRP
jgi:hypothetical protein